MKYIQIYGTNWKMGTHAEALSDEYVRVRTTTLLSLIAEEKIKTFYENYRKAYFQGDCAFEKFMSQEEHLFEFFGSFFAFPCVTNKPIH